MRTLAGLLFLLMSTSGAHAGCPEQANSLRACFAHWDEKFAGPLSQIPDPHAISPGVLIAGARVHNHRMYDSAVMIRECVRRGESLVSRCSAINRDLVEQVRRELAPLAEKMMSVQAQARARIAGYVGGANSIEGYAHYRLTCHMRAADKGGFQICFVVDRSSSDYEFIPDSKANHLPITVGVTPSCTFFVDDRGRMVSADHCREAHMRHGYLFGSEVHAVDASRTNHLKFNPVNFDIGPAIEDISVFAPASRNVYGRSFYYLALDQKMDGDQCEFRQQGILACSPEALEALDGTRAEMLSFPAPYYAGPVGEFRREAPGSVMHTKGTLKYDANFERFFVQMYAQEGASGAPVYLPSETVVGGVKLDKPLVLGPLTGISGTPGRLLDGQTDNMGVVAAVRYDRLTSVLSAPMDLFAGWVLRNTLP